jgi:excisionase family DNA binding protein
MRGERLETPDELSERLQVPKGWIYERTTRVAKNPLPYVKIGKYLRFIPAEVDSWIDRQQRQQQETAADEAKAE